GREREIQAHQKGEEYVHTELKHKIASLDTKLGKYLTSQELRKKRIAELENKIQHKFTTKQEKIKTLNTDVGRLLKLYKLLKKDNKHTPSQLLRVARRIAQLKEKIRLLR